MTNDPTGRRKPETEAVHRGEGAPVGAAPLTTPIYATTTFRFDSTADFQRYLGGDAERYIYSRYANPTIQTAEAKLAALEGAEAALVLSSGQAATTTALFGLLASGDELVVSSASYGGTLHLVGDHLSRFGVGVRYASTDELARPESLLTARTRVLWCESPTNPTLRCVDLARVASTCRAAGVVSVVDNTFASPINQRPVTLGIDLVMHSATKYLNGHSDVTAGALAGGRTLIDRLWGARKLMGGVLDPMAAHALSRGLKTLPVRVERHNENARRVAEWLEASSLVARVFYPGLPSHPDHELARRQMTGFGGMVCFEARGGFEGACRFYDRISLIQRAASLGGVESLCSLPVLTSQYGLSDEQLAAAGVTRGMVRLSIGLEHVDDLLADLAQALG